MADLPNLNKRHTTRPIPRPLRVHPILALQLSLIRGRRYNRAKKKQGGTGANQYEQSPQNEVSAKTSEVIAEQHGVSKATIERDGKFAEAVEALEIESEVIAGDIVSGSWATIAMAVAWAWLASWATTANDYRETLKTPANSFALCYHVGVVQVRAFIVNGLVFCDFARVSRRFRNAEVEGSTPFGSTVRKLVELP